MIHTLSIMTVWNLRSIKHFNSFKKPAIVVRQILELMPLHNYGLVHKPAVACFCYGHPGLRIKQNSDGTNWNKSDTVTEKKWGALTQPNLYNLTQLYLI